MTVSYTHLDVYKRQTSYNGYWQISQQDNILCCCEIFMRLKHKMLYKVSLHHTKDVYKRQLYVLWWTQVISRLFPTRKGADTMKEKRRDNKGRILHTGESQRTDGKYLYKYVDAFGNTKYVYAWRLTPTDLSLIHICSGTVREDTDWIISISQDLTLPLMTGTKNHSLP